jgi:predicted nucleotidyltransferase
MSTSIPEVRKQFIEALDDLVTQVKGDRTILAAILCGSLSHDTVWAKSDIDLALVTIDDRKVESGSLALLAGGVNVHAFLISRAEFRKTVEGAVRNSFMHSLLAKGRLLYTHDQTIADLCERLHEIGGRDVQIQLLSAATQAVGSIYKAHKWFVTRGDATGPYRGNRSATAGGPRSDPAGAEAQSGVLPDDLFGFIELKENAEDGASCVTCGRRVPRPED